MFLLNSENHLVLVAESFAERVGSTATALQGNPLATLVVDEDVPLLQRTLSGIREAGRTTQTVGCRLLVDGETEPVKIELSAVGGDSGQEAVLGTVRSDTGDGQAADERVRFHQFFDLLDDAVVEFEMAGTEPVVQAVNAAFEDIFGFQSEYIVGERLNDYIVPAADAEEATDFDRRIANGRASKGVVTRQTASGTREFFYRGLPAGREDGRRRGFAVYTDITEEQRTKEHLQVLHRVLRHNLRNELTVVLGMVDEITAKTEFADVRQAANKIATQAEKLERVSEKARAAQDILGEPPSDRVVDVGAVATDVVATARDDWPEPAITTDITTPLPVATGVRIRDALANLVENAIEHNAGDRTVRVTARRETPIHASTRGSGDQAVITVEDNGPGIPEHERAAVFDREEITKLKHGSGLGLWIVRWITESADGSVTYDRTDGWTRIRLRLPIATTGVNESANTIKEY